MKELLNLLVYRDEGLGNIEAHKDRPAAHEYGMKDVRTEQFRRIKLEECTEPRIVRVETVFRSWRHQLADSH